MSIDDAIQFVPVYLLVLFRVAGMMAFAPLFGSERIPKRMKILFAVVVAAGMCGTVTAPPNLPKTPWALALGIAGEMAFGLAMGMVLSFTFIAAQWAGEMVGQQMGLNMSEVLDPQFGQSGSLVGNLYFMLSLVIFLSLGGHRDMIHGLRRSFESLPLLSLGVDRPLLDTLIGLLGSCTTLAIQLAAPTLVTMLVVDLALGSIGKAIPQMNLMTAGLSVRALLGVVVVVVGLALTGEVLGDHLVDAMKLVQLRISSP